MWHKCGSIWAPTRAPSEFKAFFINTQDDTLEASIPAGTWVKCKIPNLPPGLKFCHALISGILIITGYAPPLTVQLPDGRYVSGPVMAVAAIDLTVAFRAVGETWDFPYTMQTCEAHKGGGQRSNACAGAPLNDAGEFEVKWAKTPAGILPNWPNGPAEGINLQVLELREKMP